MLGRIFYWYNKIMVKSRKSKTEIKTIIQNIFIYIVYAIGAALFLLMARVGGINSVIWMAIIEVCMICALAAAFACSRFNRHHLFSIIAFAITIMTVQTILSGSSIAGSSDMMVSAFVFIGFFNTVVGMQLILQLAACLLIDALKETFTKGVFTKMTSKKATSKIKTRKK